MVVKTGCVIDGKICMFQRNIMKTVITMGKKACISSCKNCLSKETPLPERTLSPHYMYAVLPIARDGHLRLHTLENPESAFTRLMTVENSDKIPVF